MTDIQQWRRMIQPTRARTPVVDLDDQDDAVTSTTPKKGLKPKLSSYFVQNPSSAPPAKPDLHTVFGASNPGWPSYGEDDGWPKPSAERLMDSLMCRIMSEPYKSLESRFNGSILRICEEFQLINDQRSQLQASLQTEIARRTAIERAMQHSAQQWDCERKAYKTEVKRLELILAKGDRGVAAVTLARQDSMLHHSTAHNDQTLERILQLLEKSKQAQEKEWGAQRAIMRQRPASPSAQMKRLSKSLVKKEPSMTGGMRDELHSNTLPKIVHSKSGKALVIQQTQRSDEVVLQSGMSNHPKLAQKSRRDASRPSSEDLDNDDDTESTFSCAGDFLSDELGDTSLAADAAVSDNDLEAIKHVAQRLAERRHIDANSIMPALLALFNPQPADSRVAQPLQQRFEQVLSSTNASPIPLVARNSSLKMKAAGLFSRRRQQPAPEIAVFSGRRFSFEAGDDTDLASSYPALDALPAAVKDRLLRKSASTSLLSENFSSRTKRAGATLSPVEHSPVNSTRASESSRKSRIPTPVYAEASLSKPRQGREDSSSSLITAVKHADDASERSEVSSSVHSSPLNSRLDLTKWPQSSSRGALVHRANLRGGLLASISGKVATPVSAEAKHLPDESSQRGITTTTDRTLDSSGRGERRLENVKPAVNKSP